MIHVCSKFQKTLQSCGEGSDFYTTRGAIVFTQGLIAFTICAIVSTRNDSISARGAIMSTEVLLFPHGIHMHGPLLVSEMSH